MREFRWTEWAQVIINFALAVIGVIALYIYDGQLKVMSGQLKEMHDSGAQTDTLIGLYQRQVEQVTKQATDTHDLAERTLAQAQATNRLAKEAKRSADIAQEAIKSQIKLSNEERRSWLGLGKVSMTKFDEQGVRLLIPFTNTGKTPAEAEFAISFSITSQPMNDTPKINLPFAASGVIAPQGGQQVIEFFNIFSPGAYQQVQGAKLFVYYIGAIRYIDKTSPTQRHTTFCFYYDPGEHSLQPCTFGNDMD